MNKNENPKNKFGIIAIIIFAFMFISVFLLTTFDQTEIAIPIFIVCWFILFFGGIIFSIVSTIKAAKSGIKVVKDVNEFNKKYAEENKTSESNQENKVEETLEKEPEYNDPFDKELDHLSQRLKSNTNFNKFGGMIKEKYTDIDKKGEVAYFAEVKDYVTNSTFVTKLTSDEYSKIYVGQEVDISRGFKRKIKF